MTAGNDPVDYQPCQQKPFYLLLQGFGAQGVILPRNGRQFRRLKLANISSNLPKGF